MGSGRESVAGRARWITVFVLLLLACSAVPVLAAEQTEAPPPDSVGFTPPTAEEEEIAAAQIPDAQDVSKALAEAEREEAEYEKWLASPEAGEQREASWLAFGELSATESEGLLRTVFAEQLEALNSDPSRYLSDAQLVRDLPGSGAVVQDEGDGALLESTVPVRTEDEDGELAKVDLSLEAAAEGFQTDNAISDLSLPDSAAGPIEVGDEDFKIAQAGAADSPARRFGDKSLFYPEVLPDTDLFVAGTSFGAELFDLLRSKDSPETLRFAIEVPQGAELRSDERGGAEVVREGELLTRIPKPWALDAQGTDVPVELEIEGSSIVLRIAHRDGDYAYPILLDPIVEDWVNQGNNWYGGANWAALSNGAWQWTTNNSNILHDICCWEGSHAGLITNVQAAFYGPEQYGHWSYSTANEKVFITHAWLIPFNRADNGCGSAQPHDYAGLWNPGGNWIPLLVNHAKNYGNASFDGYGKALILGESSGPPGVWLACGRVLYSGGVGIWLNDDWPPVIHSAGVPSDGWFGDQQLVNFSVSSGDEGLGVNRVLVFNQGKGIVAEDFVGYCTGLYGSRCPNERNSPFTVTGDSFGYGIRTASVVVTDPTGKTAESFFTTMVDNDVPEVALEGQLAEATGEEVGFGEGENPVGEGEDKLRLPVYRLNIKAKDGSTSSDLTKRSGVKDVKVFLDGEPKDVPWEPLAQCPQTSCSMDVTYELALSEIDTAGKHKLEIKAEDFVGEVKVRQIEFEYFPATGMKDEYVMHYFPLPDGQGNEEEEEHPARPELAVNVMNGNLVYRERDIDVEGPAVDLEVERYYNSQLPASENTEWGDGWTLAQTPDLEPVDTGGSPAPDEAELIDQSGALEEEVELPTEAGEENFDPALQATLTKTAGGYELTDETGESATSVAFDETGQTEARLTEGYAKVDYSYEGGELAEIAVKDPGSAGNPTEPPEEEFAPEDPGETPIFDSAFGSNGSGDGQLKSPGDVAIDAQGNIWVADKGNNRIQKFNAKGEFVAKFGASGSGNGQLSIPTSLAIDAQGNIWVTERANNRVQKFSPSGEYLTKFGTYGTGNGQFNGPEGVAIDPQGNIWISDTYNGRVQKFSSTGEFIKVVGSKGSGEGQIGEPTGIDIDAGGNLWVADWQNNRVEVFDAEGQFLDQFGSAGTGDGQFNRPDALEIDEAGNVWVGDQNNGRVQRFDVAGQYIDQFGSKGSGEGQFSFAYPMGIAASEGRIWVTDVNNHRVQEWVAAEELTTYTDVLYADSFGASGTGEGQFSYPAGVEVAAVGNLWVADRNNHRIQRFDSKGEFVSQFGTLGTENGQLKYPADLAIEEDGEVLVLDRGNARAQRFSAAGEYLGQFGSKGTGNGQFTSPFNILGPEGIAIDHSGSIWVSDTYAGRVQKFSPSGEFIEVVGSKGEGEGQFGRPTAIDAGPDGRVWVTDAQYNRVSVFDGDGQFISRFGSTGTGDGQFTYPDAIEVDAKGNVWVGDRGNDRVQLFDDEGQYVAQFGEEGSEEGQFNLAYPMAIASDGANGIWVTDVSNHRLQKWVAGNYVPDENEVLPDDDPAVEVVTPGGLVAGVDGEEAGEHDYVHEGGLLVSHDGPQGETAYEYDAAGRMTKVTLPNGTWASIKYEAFGRVKEVAVSVEGAAAKTTYFTYKDDSPRRTTVEPPDAPHVVYDIGDDGSVLKWWNTQVPPELDLSGTLYDNREEDDAIWAGDHWLDAEALSEEGIKSIQVIVNGTTLVDEMTCEQDFEVKGKECKKVIDEWVTSTDLHAPGHLQIEVIATDALEDSTNEQHRTSERFWVDIPEPPPPLAPGTPIPPKFRDIAEFREEYGLEVVFPVANEIELNERIFDLIKAWHEPNTPAGQVARATMDRWGVPLRPADAAEMEYREWYVEINGPLIEDWGYTHFPTTYSGYQVDHRSGGIIRVGFTQDQEQRVGELAEQPNLLATDRLDTFQTVPTQARISLESLDTLVADAAMEDIQLSGVTDVGIGDAENSVVVGATNVNQVEQRLTQLFGSLQGITVTYQSESPELQAGRNRILGRMLAGDRIVTEWADKVKTGCTAAFGAYEDRNRLSDGRQIRARFLLSAGHCAALDQDIFRTEGSNPPFEEDKQKWRKVGHVTRNPSNVGPDFVDSMAIRLEAEGLAPHSIYGRDDARPSIEFPAVGRRGERLCVSGAKLGGVRCGQVLGIKRVYYNEVGRRIGVLKVDDLETTDGDSGAPVWNARTGASVGILSGGFKTGTVRFVLPLLNTPTGNNFAIPGGLKVPEMYNLHLITDG
jgi:YD repeat-containing protein